MQSSKGVISWSGLEECFLMFGPWGMINFNDVSKEMLHELLKLALIWLIQCSSTATCERGFSRLNLNNWLDQYPKTTGQIGETDRRAGFEHEPEA